MSYNNNVILVCEISAIVFCGYNTRKFKVGVSHYSILYSCHLLSLPIHKCHLTSQQSTAPSMPSLLMCPIPNRRAAKYRERDGSLVHLFFFFFLFKPFLSFLFMDVVIDMCLFITGVQDLCHAPAHPCLRPPPCLASSLMLHVASMLRFLPMVVAACLPSAFSLDCAHAGSCALKW